MGDSIAVSVQNVSKKFRLFGSPKDRLREALHPFKRKYHHEFWALKDISFEVPRGMTFGIVGRNGSGKSTLLQIICSVMRPTSGTVSVNGRVSALLELGAGFNPEFTGRENVLLKGAIMGFARSEMEERLPLIENFADIGEFIDQPVKTYSSGMFVRLAFAAAINVDPDILIVDEALAVGDAKFQHKCYNKFLEFQKKGKTILFVSHSTDAIVRHCDCAVLLENGKLLESGEPKTVTNYYLDLLFSGQTTDYASKPVLIEEGYRGFSIVHYKTKYYAFPQHLWHKDVDYAIQDRLNELIAENKCIVAASLQEARGLIGKLASTDADSIIHIPPANQIEKEKTELDKFFEKVPAFDNCVNRRSYNKHEYRYGDKRVEVIDYLVVANGQSYDDYRLKSDDMVDIYIKIKCNKTVERPSYGFAVKTIDGVMTYGTNVYLAGSSLPRIHKGDMAIWKFSFSLHLFSQGDYFIDIGCAERDKDVDFIPMDRRYGLIHLYVDAKERFGGIMNLKSPISEVCRRQCSLVATK